MKRLLLVLAFLPLVSFGSFEYNGYTFERMRIFTYTSAGVTTRGSSAFTVFPSSLESLESSLMSSTFGFCVNPIINSTQKNIAPNPTSSQFFIVGNASSPTITNSLYCYVTTNTLDRYNVSAHYLPTLSAIYYSASTLYLQGYRGSAIVDDFQGDLGVHCVNIHYPTLVADVLSSTNTVYRQILFSYLNQIQSSLTSIGSSVGTINQDYQFVNNLYLDPSKQNLLDSVANPSSLNANSSVSANLDRLFGSSYAGRESEITKALSDLARSQLQAAWLSTLDPDSPFYMQNLDNIISDPQTFQQAALQGGGGGGSAIANIMRDVKKLSTNDWVAGVTNQLANNRASITNQLAHMFDDDTSVGSKLGNIEASSSQSASSAGSIDERLARGITVAVVNSGANSVLVSLDGPINIDSTQFNSLSVPLGSLQNTVSDWYSDWYSFFSVSSPSYKWENFYNMVSAFKDQNHSDLVAVTNSLSSLSSLSNVLASIDDQLKNAFPNITNLVVDSSPFSALLLDHYEDYITNSVYADSISKLQSDYPSVYSNLVAFGLSPSGDGDFWSLFGSSLIQLDLMADNFISDMAKVRKFADDNIQGGFSAGISSIVEVMPKKEDIVSAASSASNIVSALDLSSTNVVFAFHSVTSQADSVFSPFHGSFETVPSDLVLFKTGNEKYITIPVHEHPEAFRLMRWGFSFALAAVNFIFFPKFVLMLVMLFSKLSQRFVKFYPSVKNE